MDPISLALGFLGGGGSTTSQQSTLTNNSSLQNSFNPNNNVSFGGGFNSAPYAGITGNPSANSSASLTPTASAQGLGGQIGAVVPSVSTGLLDGPLPMLALAGVAIFVLTKK